MQPRATTPNGFADARGHHAYGVDIDVIPALGDRNRLTCAFRIILAIPHMLLVGGPIAFAVVVGGRADSAPGLDWGVAAGALGSVAAVAALIAWFAIVFTGRAPAGLWDLAAYYLRWRVRAAAYLTMLRDEYPPFGDASYPAVLLLDPPSMPRDRLSVALRPILAIPQIFALWLLGIGLAISTLLAWVSILVTGNFPPALYRFTVGVVRWSTRVEAYVLLLRDDYPPFSLD